MKFISKSLHCYNHSKRVISHRKLFLRIKTCITYTVGLHSLSLLFFLTTCIFQPQYVILYQNDLGDGGKYVYILQLSLILAEPCTVFTSDI